MREPGQQPLILVVDDEEPIARLLRLELSSEGFRVQTACSGEEGLRLVERDQPDLILLDIVMPGMSGLDVLERVKAQFPTPVVMITAQSSEEMRTRALDLGADDFVTKPFSPERVAEIVRFLLRSGEEAASSSQIIEAGDLKIDLPRERVWRGNVLVRLSRSEWLLLRELARRPGVPLLYQELLTAVWGSAYREDIDYLRLWLRRLRAKLGGPAGDGLIREFHGVAFSLHVPPRNRS